jgi:hypothetical protein
MKDFSYTGWRKSSYSTSSANCVEVAFARRTGSATDEPRIASQLVGVRDSKQHGRGPVLEFSAAAWNTFLDTTKAGVTAR